MTWAVTAAVGVGVVSSYQAGQSADKANKAASKASKAALDFERQKYNDWKGVYGDIEANLAAYYNNLTPELYAARGLDAFKKEQEQAMTRVRETLAQRGITDSGVLAAVETQAEISGAETRAGIRQEAETATMAAKQGFLQIGLNQNPSAGLSAALQNNAMIRANQADSQQRAAAAAWGSTAALATKGVLDYASSQRDPTISSSGVNVSSGPGVWSRNQ